MPKTCSRVSLYQYHELRLSLVVFTVLSSFSNDSPNYTAYSENRQTFLGIHDIRSIFFVQTFYFQQTQQLYSMKILIYEKLWLVC